MPVAVPRLDHGLPPRAVAHRPARQGHAGIQCLVADGLPGPDLLHQLTLGHDAVAVCEQVGEHLEHLGPDVHQRPGAGQRICLGIEGRVAKHVEHVPSSRIGTSLGTQPWTYGNGASLWFSPCPRPCIVPGKKSGKHQEIARNPSSMPSGDAV